VGTFLPLIKSGAFDFTPSGAPFSPNSHTYKKRLGYDNLSHIPLYVVVGTI